MEEEGLVDLNIKAPIVIPSPNNRDVEKGGAGGVPDPQGMILHPPSRHWIST
jgi:hypothetical protein